MDEAQDTGARLRALYESAGGVRAVFSPKVGDYAASRPDYPAALFEMLATEGGLTAAATVADVGAGTGLLTQGLLRLGCRVVAVEPNADMRRAADRLLSGAANYRSVEGSAEAMPLADGSVDLITAAQAFHWFEVDRARQEFLRVLKPAGQVALIWNDRGMSGDPLNQALEDLCTRFGGARRGALAARDEQSDVPRFFGAVRPREYGWPHAHRLDEKRFLALIFSRSYIPARDTDEGRAVADAARAVFRRFATGNTVEVRYRTVTFLGRPG